MTVKNRLGIFLLSLILGSSLAWAEPWKEVKDPEKEAGNESRRSRCGN